jgi:serine/threonine protein kinase
MKNRRYIAQEKLGAGGMGVVYTAKDRLTGEIVALKRVLIPSEKMAQDSHTKFLTALATEFRTLAGLRHPHIVRVIDYGFNFEEGQPQPYFTMEYLPGARTLTKAAYRQPLETQVRLLTEMLMALAYLHRRGVIHRDLKADNVLVDSSGRVKVLDFGLALGATGKSGTNMGEGLVGTLAYMAPELFVEETATVRSDLYAVGVLIYEIFTGQFPFNQKNFRLLVDDIMNRAPDMNMFDAELSTLVARLLAKNPLARSGAAEEVIRDLCAATYQPLPPESIAIR